MSSSGNGSQNDTLVSLHGAVFYNYELEDMYIDEYNTNTYNDNVQAGLSKPGLELFQVRSCLLQVR